MRRAICEGDLEETETLLKQAYVNFYIDSRICEAYSPLIYACQEANLNVVEYLIREGANVNVEIDSYSPLMMACKSEANTNRVTEVVKLLIKEGAVINQSCKYGDTPLMFACQYGHQGAVELLIEEASLDATSNVSGNSAIFYAIESNSIEIVRMLIANGAQFRVANRKGYLPKNVAEIHGFYDIVNLFPDDGNRYRIPTQYTSLTHYTDLVPGLFAPPTIPPYFYRIGAILTGIELDVLHEKLAESEVSLPNFLTMSEKKLDEVGIKLPIIQQKIMHGLFRLHARPWGKRAIVSVSKSKRVDTFNLYSMFASHLQQLVIIRSSLVFLIQLMRDRNLGDIERKDIVHACKTIDCYQKNLEFMYLYVNKVKALGRQALVDEIDARKATVPPPKNGIKSKVLKYASIFGLVTLATVLVRLKLK